MSQSDFILDPRIAADTLPVGDLALCQVRLMDDETYPWLLLLPRRAGASEIIDLDEADRQQLMAEITLVSEVLKARTGCHKLNVAALGNMVPQLHIHVIARFRDDPAWPGPVWGRRSPVPYAETAGNALVNQLRASLPIS